MIPRSSLLYSAAAIKRMWGLHYRRPSEIKVREWSSVVWVWVPGYRPRFVSKAEFQRHFVEWRRQAAQELRAEPWSSVPGRFTVYNDAKGTSYVVDVSAEGVDCPCEDYKNQVLAWGKGCCKHGYASLAQLGFSSLGEYLASVPQRPELLASPALQPSPPSAVAV